MASQRNLSFVFDTSFFHSINDAVGTRKLEEIIAVIKALKLRVLVSQTVLEEYRPLRIFLQKHFNIINDRGLDISRLKRMNAGLSSRAFEVGEDGDFRFIALALQEWDKGYAPIIITNDEGFRTFVKKALNAEKMDVSFTADFLRFLSQQTMRKSERRVLEEAAYKVESRYRAYRLREKRGEQERNILESVLSFIGSREAPPEVHALEEQVKKYLKGANIKDLTFPSSFQVFQDVLEEFEEKLLTGGYRKAREVLDSFPSRIRKQFEKNMLGHVEESMFKVLINGYYRVALFLDEDGDWWEALSLLQSIYALYMIQDSPPPKRLVRLLELSNYVVSGVSSFSPPKVPYSMFLQAIKNLDLEYLHSLHSLTRQVGHEELFKFVDELIVSRSKLPLSNKMKRELKGRVLSLDNKTALKTPFDDVLLVDSWKEKNGVINLFVQSISGKLCLRFPVSDDVRILSELRPGRMLELRKGEIVEIKAAPLGGDTWEATFVFKEQPEWNEKHLINLLELSKGISEVIDHLIQEGHGKKS